MRKIALIGLVIVSALLLLGCTQPPAPASASDLNVPYSFLAVHFEIDPSNSEAADRWQDMVSMVDLANQYNTKLTIMFWPGSVDYALASPEKAAKVREWQSQGHEIGMHNQGCYGVTQSCLGPYECYKQEDNPKYMELAGSQEIKSGTSEPCAWLLPTYEYSAEGRFDGRSSVAIKYRTDNDRELLALNIKAGYLDNPPCGGTQTKINEYNTLNPDEIYGFADHGEGETVAAGGAQELTKWLEFLHSKDPEGKKRLTLSKIMEEYVIPNNLVISSDEICSSTDTRVQQCLPLAVVPEKPGLPSCRIGSLGTEVFNLGRCIRTGTYCAFEDGASCDGSNYCPQGCIAKGIGEFNPLDQNICTGTPSTACTQQGGIVCPSDQSCAGTQTKMVEGLCCVGTCTGGKSGASTAACNSNGTCDKGEDTNSCPADCTSSVKPLTSSCDEGQVLCAIGQACDGTKGEKLPEGQCCSGTCD